MNLMFVLINAKRPVSREVIKTKVPGYSDSQSAFERMFERDKEDLRDAGLVVKAVPIDESFDDQLGYIVTQPLEQELPVRFSAREIALLRLAAEAWRDPQLRAVSSQAAIKAEAVDGAQVLRSEDAELQNLRLLPGAVSVKAVPIFSAIEQRCAISFAYRKPAEAKAPDRQVLPRQMFSRGGHWYLNGFDLGEGQVRTFRLSRMVSQPVILKSSPMDLKHLEAAAGEPALIAEEETQLAVLWVSCEAPGEVQRSLLAQMTDIKEVSLHNKPGHQGQAQYWDVQSFAASLVPFAPHVIVISPSILREATTQQALLALGPFK